MNEHDVEIILALAEGRLTGPEAGAERERVEADPELAAELAAQESVATSLRGAAAAMTVAERDQLHHALRTQLHLDDEPAAAPVPLRRKWWVPIAGLASAAAVVAGFAIFLPGQDSDLASDGVALPAETATRETLSTASGESSAEEAPEAGADAGEAPESVADEPAQFLGVPGDIPPAQELLEGFAAATSRTTDVDELSPAVAEQLADCADELDSLAQGRDPEPFLLGGADGSTVAVSYPATGEAGLTVVVLELGSCTIVDSATES